MNILLWIAQVLLALFFLAAGYSHGLMPIDQAAKNAPWMLDLPSGLVRFIAFAELAGAIGVLIPRLARLAALGLMTIMVLAAAFHISRGETRIIVMHVCVAAIAALVWWGRRQG